MANLTHTELSDGFCDDCNKYHRTAMETTDWDDLRAGELFRFADGLRSAIYRKTSDLVVRHFAVYRVR